MRLRHLLQQTREVGAGLADRKGDQEVFLHGRLAVGKAGSPDYARSSIDIAAISHLDDKNSHGAILDVADDAEVADAVAPKIAKWALTRVARAAGEQRAKETLNK